MSKDPIRHFDAAAPFYNFGVKRLTFGVYSRFLRLAVGELELQAGEKVLDVCTGTGINLMSIASQVGETGEVVGIDLSPGMLKIAERDIGERTNIRLLHGDITVVEGFDCYFDKALMSFGLHEIEPGSRARALQHIRGMLKERGLLVIADYNNIPYEERGPIARMGFRMVEGKGGREYLSMDLKSLLTEQGFTHLHQIPFFKENLLVTKISKAAERDNR